MPWIFMRLKACNAWWSARRGGETGVKAVQMIEGDAVWKAGEEGRYSKDLLTAALSRSDTPLGLTVTDGRTQDLVGIGPVAEAGRRTRRRTSSSIATDSRPRC